MSGMKKTLAAVILLVCLALPAGCASPSAVQAQSPRKFTDSLGQTSVLPEKIEKLAVTGPMAQIYVFSLCPELLVGFSAAFSKDAEKYIPAEYLALPELGQLYGGKGTMNLESLLSSAPDAVIDIGKAKVGMKGDFDRLTEQTGIPFIHIDADIISSPETYRMLGELIGDSARAEELAAWCEKTLHAVSVCMEKVDLNDARKDVVYCLGSKGLNVLADGSYHAQILSLCASNAAVLGSLVSNGDGNEIDIEQLILWDPDVILFQHGSAYDTVAGSSTWRELRAVRDGEFYEIPCGPYGWISSPPAVQCYLGMLWLTDKLYPEYCGFDLKSEVTDYYKLFYRYDLSDADYSGLVGGPVHDVGGS